MNNREFDTDFNLTNKVAVVTGGSSGIGKAVAQLFEKKGAKVVILDAKANTPNIAKEIAPNMLGILTDVTSKASVNKALDEVEAKVGQIDILVNSAGVVYLNKAENLSEADWDLTFDVNVKGTFLVAQAVGQRLLKRGKGGKIVNMASQASRVALDKHVAYCASKGAVVSMTQVMAMEWAPSKINVNCVSPTVILTELGEKAWAGQVGEDMKKLIPMGRFGYPEEVAAAILYLVSDAASLITGENLVMDGGYTIK